jgi:hypothetical protein
MHGPYNIKLTVPCDIAAVLLRYEYKQLQLASKNSLLYGRSIKEFLGKSPKEYRLVYAYLLIPWSRVLVENLTGLQLVKKFPAFYGTRRFITAFTSTRHLSLS